MIDIYLDKVKLNNCRGYIGEAEMDFPINSYTVLMGKNGAGKSTFVKSVSMALFGEDGAPSGEKLTVVDMVNKKVGKDLEIIVFLRIINSETSECDEYRIELYYEHRIHHNQLILFKNNIDISGETKSDTYNKIRSLIYPSDIYHNVAYFGQQVKNFFTSLKNSEQKRIFDSILQTKVYDIYYQNNKNVVSELEDSVSLKSSELEKCKLNISWVDSAIENETKKIERNIEENRAKINQYNKLITDVQSDIDEIKRYIGSINWNESELDKAKNDLAIKLSIQSQLQSKKESAIDQLNEKNQSELKHLLNDVASKYQNDLSEKNNVYKQLVVDCDLEIHKCELKKESISKQYPISVLELDKSKFRHDKKDEIDQVTTLILNLDNEFSIKDIQSEKDQRLDIIKRNIQDYRNDASVLKTKAQNLNDQLKIKLDDIKKDRQLLSQDHPICIKCKQEIVDQEHLDSAREDLKLKVAQSEKMEVTLDEYQKQMNQLKEDFSVAEELLTTTSNDYDLKINNVNNKRNDKLKNLNEKKQLLLSEIDKYESQIDDKIEDYKSKIESETLEIQKEIIKWSDIKTKASNDYSEDTKKISHLLEKETDEIKIEHNKKYQLLESNIISSIDKEFCDLTIQIEAVKDSVQRLEKIKIEYDEYKSTLNSKTIQLKMYMDEIEKLNSYETDELMLNEYKSQKIEFNLKHEQIFDEIKSLNEDIDMLKFWKVGFSDSGIKSMLIDIAIPLMNKSVSKILDIIAPGMFTVSFDTLSETKSGDIRDKFSVNVIHNIKGTDSHKLLSGGEKRIVDLACMEALRSLSETLHGKRIHWLFYDEVLDSLDSDNRQIFCQAAKVLTTEKNTTLITHIVSDDMEPDRIFKI